VSYCSLAYNLLQNAYGGGEGSRTPVQKQFTLRHTTILKCYNNTAKLKYNLYVVDIVINFID